MIFLGLIAAIVLFLVRRRRDKKDDSSDVSSVSTSTSEIADTTDIHFETVQSDYDEVFAVVAHYGKTKTGVSPDSDSFYSAYSEQPSVPSIPRQQDGMGNRQLQDGYPEQDLTRATSVKTDTSLSFHSAFTHPSAHTREGDGTESDTSGSFHSATSGSFHSANMVGPEAGDSDEEDRVPDLRMFESRLSPRHRTDSYVSESGTVRGSCDGSFGERGSDGSE